MDIIAEKEKIINWIKSLDNPVLIGQLMELKKRNSGEFDFDKEWANRVSIDEARKKTKEFIELLPWKK